MTSMKQWVDANRKEQMLHIALVFLIIAIYFFPYFNIHTMPARGDPDNPPDVHTTDLMALLGIYPMEMRKTIDEYGQFPFWSPWRFGGTPIFEKPQAVFFYINLPLILFAPTIFAGIKWSILLHFLIAGISMYALMRHLTTNNLASFVSMVVYVFNGYIISRLNWGQTNIIYPYAWIPLIILFTFLAFERRQWHVYSVLIGSLFALMILSGGAQMVLYFGAIYSCSCVVYLLLNKGKRSFLAGAISLIKIGCIAGIVAIGLSAVFILPSTSLVGEGVRSEGYSFEQSAGAPFSIFGGAFPLNWDFVKGYFITPHFLKTPHKDWDSTGIGMVGFLLVLLSFLYLRKRMVLLFVSIFVLTFLLLKGSVLYYLFWKYIPMYAQIKGLHKGSALYFLSLSVLAGYGFCLLQEKVSRYSRKISLSIQYGIIFLLLINLTFFNNRLGMLTEPSYELEKNEVLRYISQDKELHRFWIFETKGIDWGTEHYSVPLGIDDVYGTENTWPPEYLPLHLSQANQNPAKGYGMLNLKYLVSSTPLNISGFSFIKKFNECGTYPNGADVCQPKKSDGPYLYLNELFLPRAYMVDTSIVVVGDGQSVLQGVYYLYNNPAFNPSKTVIIHGAGLVDQNEEWTGIANAVVLTPNSIGSNSNIALQKWKNAGKMIIPDITEGKNSFSAEELDGALKGLSGNDDRYNDVERVEFEKYTPNLITVKTDGKKGVLVLSEQFSLYRGWSARDQNGNELKIYRANGVNSAVIVTEGMTKITLSYEPPSFVKGAVISSVTLLGVIVFFIIHLRNKKSGLSSEESKEGASS